MDYLDILIARNLKSIEKRQAYLLKCRLRAKAYYDKNKDFILLKNRIKNYSSKVLEDTSIPTVDESALAKLSDTSLDGSGQLMITPLPSMSSSE